MFVPIRSIASEGSKPNCIEQAVATYLDTVTPLVKSGIIPIEPSVKQQAFLLLAHSREVFYGGAARGGKTFAMLMAAAQFVNVPEYAALLIRRTYSDLSLPGGLIELSKRWWSDRASWHDSRKTWTWPSGATISFSYLDRDDSVYRYKGSRFQFIGIDELTDHTEYRYQYLFSRLDRPNSGAIAKVPLRMRATSNPGGVGHEWVRRRFLLEPAKGRVFVPARLEDNPGEDREAYDQSLSYLDPVTRRQLRDGIWDAVEGGRFKAAWFGRFSVDGSLHKIGDRIIRQADIYRKFATVDPAASASTSADYTVMTAWLQTKDNVLLCLDMVRKQLDIPDIVPELKKFHAKHGFAFIGIESVGANSAVYREALRTAIPVIALSPKGKDKLVRSQSAIVLAKSGRIWLPDSGYWVEDALAELTVFTGDEKKDSHDDVVDTFSYAAEIVAHDLGQASRKGTPKIITV